jgi:PucR family transcriptional regulator, purine catabolism regulatory protein
MQGLTVASLAERLGLEILAGVDEAAQREVTTVHVIELEDPTSHLMPGELILTNGVWRRAASQSAPYASRLLSSGVAGLGYGLVRDGERVPDDVISACERIGLPLLAIGPEERFVAIAEAVFAWGQGDRRAVLDRSISRTQRLAATLASGGGLERIVDLLNDETGLRIALIRNDGRAIAHTEPPPRAELCQHAVDAAHHGDGPTRLGPGAMSFPIDGTHLLVVGAAAGVVGSAPREAVEQALPFISLELRRLSTVRDLERRYGAELVSLVEAGPSQHAVVEARLAVLGFQRGQPLCFAVAIRADDTPARPRGDLPGRTVVTDIGNTIIVLTTAGDVAAVTEELSGLHEVAAVGVGEPTASAAGLQRSLVEARRAAELVGRMPTREGNVLSHREVGRFQVLLSLHEPQVLVAFRDAVLGPLLDYDRARSSQLLPTLEAYIASEGAWQATAKQLSVHENTLRYRMSRIRDLTGIDPTRPSARVDFQLALWAHAHVGAAAPA